MSKRKKPKFAVGNSVVILLNGIVGIIKSVQELNHTFVYEVHGAEGVYSESSLLLLEDFEGLLLDAEHVNIDYRFFIGDLVQVKGYGNDVFKVIGFRTEIWRYKEESWEDIIYELSRIEDDEWLECGEEDLVLLADAKEAEQYLRKKASQKKQAFKKTNQKYERSITSHKSVHGDAKSNSKKKEMVNHLLDIYNDYRVLHEMFGDEEYRKVMTTAIKKMKRLVADREQDEKKSTRKKK